MNFANFQGTHSMCPGFTNKQYFAACKEIAEKRATLAALQSQLSQEDTVYKQSKNVKDLEKTVETAGKIEALEKEIAAGEIRMNAGEFDIDPAYINTPYAASEIPFSLGDTNGRFYIGRKWDRMPVDHYDETVTAPEFDPDNTDPNNNAVALVDLLSTVHATDDQAVTFDSNITFGLSARNDDPETFGAALDHAHAVGLVNAENKKAFEILRRAKDPISLDAAALNLAINQNLSGKGKRNAVVVVNHSGFAKLDIDDANGAPIVTRDAEGRFVYKQKYIIQEVADEILPNTPEGGSPVIVGDLSIVKFFVMRDESLAMENYLTVNDRTLRKEMVVLSTISDRAYIHGVI